MRYVFLLGGIAGFSLGAGTSFWMERAPDRVFLDGSVGCLIGALLFRWLWQILLKGLQETVRARQQAAAADAAKNHPELPILKS